MGPHVPRSFCLPAGSQALSVGSGIALRAWPVGYIGPKKTSDRKEKPITKAKVVNHSQHLIIGDRKR